MEALLSVGVAPSIEVLNAIRKRPSIGVAVSFVAEVKPFAVLGALGGGDGMTTKVIQELVDDTRIKGALKFFVTHVDRANKSTTWGLRLEGEAQVKSSERTTGVKESKVNAISIGGGSNSKIVIALWNSKNEAVVSIALCRSEAHCKEDEYCDLTFGACTEKVGRGSICLVDKVCKKRFTCVRGFCNRRCTEGCNDFEYCDTTFKVCAPKVGKGTPCVEDKVCSGSLACVRGFCNRRCSEGCNDGEYCDTTFKVCAPKVGKGTPCLEDKVCSGDLVCKTGFCNNGSRTTLRAERGNTATALSGIATTELGEDRFVWNHSRPRSDIGAAAAFATESAARPAAAGNFATRSTTVWGNLDEATRA
ncbi:hypothetical protein BSKO_09126 [Bryopsis sp. KO-2023]|nr:hypothetical protein BSKO_09126 [Bryopsis sp. KO-2023]